MKKFSQSLYYCFVAMAASSGVAACLWAQSTTVLDPACAGASMVSGKASAGQGPLTIYDLSYPVRTSLGTTQSMDRGGNFAATLNSRLILNHHIIVVDRNGVTSPEMVVSARPPTPAHP